MSLRVNAKELNIYESISQPKFPGKGADFVHTHGNWEIFDSRTELVRELSFSSKTSDSFFTKMGVFGYLNGSIILSVNFKESEAKAAKNYFAAMKFPISTYLCIFDAQQRERRVALFKILTDYNKIPEEHFKLLEDLSKANNWHEVTPLKPGEQLPQERPPALYDFDLYSMNQYKPLKKV